MAENLLFIAGEVSGDMHAAEVMRELKVLKGDIAFFGIGGDQMISEGLTPLVHIKRMAFLGFVEVLRHLPYIRKVQKELMNLVVEKQIKTAVLIDYPGFNLNFAKKLKKAGVKIVYYISPQIWAWGSGRIKKIKQLVDRMLVILPFEEKFYKAAGVHVEFVGHPLVEQLDRYSFLSRADIYAKYSIPADREILLVLPGSRRQEIERIFPEVISAAIEIGRRHNLEVVVGCAPSISEDDLSGIAADGKYLVIKDNVFDFMRYARVGIIKSGTSTLQAGLLGLPMVIVYKTNQITYYIGEKLVKIGNIGLANIVAGKTIVPELIQHELNKNCLVSAVEDVLQPAKYSSIKDGLSRLKEELGNRQASINCAKSIAECLNEH